MKLKNFFKKKLKEEEHGDLNIDVKAKIIKEGGIMKAIEEKEKEIKKEKAKQQFQNSAFGKWMTNVKNTKKNFQKVRDSPYASLSLALKARKIIIGILIPIIAYMTYNMIAHSSSSGIMGFITNLFTIGIMGYICWILYRTIPSAKKQLEYYKKYPHLINYCPTNAKETVNDILEKIKENKKDSQLKSEKREEKNVR